MTKDNTMTIHNEEEATMKEHAMTKNLSTLQALALAALIAFCAPGAYAGPAGQAGKVADKATAKAVVGETIQASAEKAVREAAQKVAREAAERAARETAERAAREAAERAARKGVAAEVVKTVTRPGNILAVGAGTAAVVGSHNVSKGVRNSAEAVGGGIGKGIETVAEKNPELLPQVIREGTRPFSDTAHILQCLVALVIIGVALWMGLPYLVSLRRRIARNVARADQENPASRFCDREDGEVVDAEYEMRG